MAVYLYVVSFGVIVAYAGVVVGVVPTVSVVLVFGQLLVLIMTCYLKCFAQRPTSGASNLVNFKSKPYLRFVSSTNSVSIMLYMPIFGYVS